MSPVNHNVDAVDTEQDTQVHGGLSDMRRCSLALAFSPARHRRRKNMEAYTAWFKSKLGVHRRRFSHSH